MIIHIQMYAILCKTYTGMYTEGGGTGSSSSECGEEMTGDPRSDTHLGFFESLPDDKETLKDPAVRLVI